MPSEGTVCPLRRLQKPMSVQILLEAIEHLVLVILGLAGGKAGEGFTHAVSSQVRGRAGPGGTEQKIQSWLA